MSEYICVIKPQMKSDWEFKRKYDKDHTIHKKKKIINGDTKYFDFCFLATAQYLVLSQ